MKLDLGRVNFAKGNLIGSIESDALSDTVKAFVIGSIGSTEDAIFNLKALESISPNAKVEIKILLAAHLICSGARSEAVSILNSLGKITDDSFTGEFKDYFVSTITFLMKVLSQQNFDFANPNKKLSVIGDSHVLGISGSVKNREKFNCFYIPGITFQFLASPFNNLKKEAFLNAACLSQNSDSLLFSVGEIEMRSVFDNLKRVEFQLDKLYSNFCLFLDFFDAYRVPDQNIILTEPPFPKNLNTKSGDQPLNAYKRFCEKLYKKCKSRRINLIKYKKPIGGHNIHNDRDNFFVDHGHYVSDYYFQLLSDAKCQYD